MTKTAALKLLKLQNEPFFFAIIKVFADANTKPPFSKKNSEKASPKRYKKVAKKYKIFACNPNNYFLNSTTGSSHVN